MINMFFVLFALVLVLVVALAGVLNGFEPVLALDGFEPELALSLDGLEPVLALSLDGLEPVLALSLDGFEPVLALDGFEPVFELAVSCRTNEHPDGENEVGIGGQEDGDVVDVTFNASLSYVFNNCFMRGLSGSSLYNANANSPPYMICAGFSGNVCPKELAKLLILSMFGLIPNNVRLFVSATRTYSIGTSTGVEKETGDSLQFSYLKPHGMFVILSPNLHVPRYIFLSSGISHGPSEVHITPRCEGR